MHWSHLLPAVAALAVAQTSTTTSSSVPADVVPTPDALDIEALRDIPDPTYTTIDELMSQDVDFNTATAVATISAEVAATPRSVFPAVPTIAINAAGDGAGSGTTSTDPSDDVISSGPTATATATLAERDGDGLLLRRTACAAQATIANYYGVNVTSYSTFKADPIIASVASAAATPAGYFQNFVNLPGANSAYGDCATKCTAKSGCLAFNIYFERDPTLSPGTGCDNPPAIANIKCSFWGSSLDSTTANNYGQWQDNFQVGIAGSNAYTSYTFGGPITGWTSPLNLNNSVMNAPLRDCAGTWTYLGYKLIQSGPFDPTLCAAACDAQTAYNVANPPASGEIPVCGAFGTYLLTKTNSSGSFPQGQMCTMYTSLWGSQYAVNTASYDDSDVAKYTYSDSFFYSKTAIQPICPSDISYLLSAGSDFCSAYISYSQPTTTVLLTTTPSGFATVTSEVATVTTGTITTTGTVVWKRDSTDVATNATFTTATGYTTVDSLPTDSVAILTQYQLATPVLNGTALASQTAVEKRALVTPASISAWPSYKISEACSQVATGVVTVLTTTTASLPTTTVQGTSTVASICALPNQLASTFSWTAIYGAWDSVNGQPASNPAVAWLSASTVQLPFNVCMFGTCTSVLSVGTDGVIKFGNIVLSVYSGHGYTAYMYAGGRYGLFYRITGEVGSRELVFAWYTGTYDWGHQSRHFTMTFSEDDSNQVQYKYYDAVQAASYDEYANVYVQIGSSKTYMVPYGTFVDVGSQYTIKTSTDGSVLSSSKTLHDRIECCTKAGWHSCTEFTGLDSEA
ncbi:hypothetical protein BDV97DRAFT_394603 [Delphinella strobiligena]|nr:hypothetical protein BDV97DRAFT_394603 [Delphinella strobiligena]